MQNYTEKCPAYLTNTAGNYLHDSLSLVLDEAGYTLSKPQLRILLYLYEEDGLEQKLLRENVKLSKISVIKIINDLEEDNLVVRIPSENDMRNNRIFLTPLGKKLKSPLHALLDIHRNYIFAGFSEEELALYKKFLQRIIKNLTCEDCDTSNYL